MALVSLFKEQLENESAAMAEARGLSKRGDYLIWWYFSEITGLPLTDIEEVVCDGFNDLGIDAIRIDDAPLVHFYNFKNPANITDGFPSGDVDKLLGGLNLILAERHKALANDALRARVEEIANVVPIGYRIHLVTSDTGLSPDSRVKLDTFIANLKAPSDDFCTWELEDIHRLQDTFY